MRLRYRSGRRNRPDSEGSWTQLINDHPGEVTVRQERIGEACEEDMRE